MANRDFNKQQALEHGVKEIYAEFSVERQRATATLNVSTDIVLASVASGYARNDSTFQLAVNAAAANPTDTVLVAFTGTAENIICTVTPNDGTNNDTVAATATLDVSTDIVLTSVALGAQRNTETFQLAVNVAAANPTDTVLVAFTGTAAAIVCTVTPNDGTNNGTVAATSTLDVSTDIVLTSVALGAQRNTETFQLVVNAAAPNTDDEVLVAFTGTAAAIVCTVTPNNGANNGATPVDLSEDQLTELINTGAVAAFTGGGAGTLVLTDASSRRILQTATGGAAANALVAGDNQTVSFTGGVSVAVSLDEDELTELINSGLVAGKTITLTDGSSLRILQTATGGAAADALVAGNNQTVSFSGGVEEAVSLDEDELAELINNGTVAGKTITLTDGSSLRALQTATGGAAANALVAGDNQTITFANGAATPTDESVLGIASISQTDTGLYVITLADAYNSIKSAHVIHKSSSVEDLSFQIKAEDVDVAKTVSIQALAGAVATDPADGTSILVKLELKNSSVED